MPLGAGLLQGASQGYQQAQQAKQQRELQRAMLDLQQKRFKLEDQEGQLKMQTLQQALTSGQLMQSLFGSMQPQPQQPWQGVPQAMPPEQPPPATFEQIKPGLAQAMLGIGKPEEAMKLMQPGEVKGFGPDQTLYQDGKAIGHTPPAAGGKIGTISPEKFTPESMARFQRTLNYGDLQPAADEYKPPTSYQEWELAGRPGTYADFLKEQNVKAPTAAQQTVAEYAARLEQAEPLLAGLESAIQNMNIVNFGAQIRLPAAAQTSEVQQYMQAARNFVNAKLRRESGAVISQKEFAEARQQYLPQPGDSEKTLQQKAANRKLVYQSLRKAAGNAYQSVDELMGTGTPSAPVRKTLNGQSYIKRDGQWFKE